MLKLKSCNKTDSTGRFGGTFCKLSQLMSFLLVDRSVRIDPSNFNKAKLDELIAQDKIIGAVKWDNAEDANVDPGFTDLSTGERIQNTRGLKRWNFMFYKGNCFQNQLDKLSQIERYSFIGVPEEGTILAQQLKDGMIKGFDVKLFTGVYNAPVTAEASGSTLMVDLTRSAMSGWQGSSAEYESDEIDFNELNPIAALNIQLPVLTAGQTTTVAKITNLCADSPVTGLDTAASWKMYRNGVAEAVTAVSEINGTYTFTHAAFVAEDKISFKTEVAGYPVFTLDTSYYVGVSPEKEVA